MLGWHWRSRKNDERKRGGKEGKKVRGKKEREKGRRRMRERENESEIEQNEKIENFGQLEGKGSKKERDMVYCKILEESYDKKYKFCHMNEGQSERESIALNRNIFNFFF